MRTQERIRNKQRNALVHLDDEVKNMICDNCEYVDECKNAYRKMFFYVKCHEVAIELLEEIGYEEL